MEHTPGSGDPDSSGRPEACGLLTCEQVRRLEAVLTEVVPVHGRGNFPTLAVSLREVVGRVRAGLRQRGVAVRDVRLNGSTASHVLVEDEGQGCRDLDLVFHLDLPQGAGFQHQEAGFQHQEAEFHHPGAWSQHQEVGPQHYRVESQLQGVGFQAQEAGFHPQGAGFELAREAVLDALRDFLPSGVNQAKITPLTLTEAYVQKLVKVSTETDRWSLVSLCNNAGRNVELKFVERIRRQFEFSVDSFQIVLDPLLDTPPAPGGAGPAVAVESVYGDLAEALAHLRERLIATRRPEQIRGGGLLKFCSLVTRGFRPADPAGLRSLQRYMTSRFFIDFPSLRAQRRHLEAYLRSHLPGAGPERHAYLSVLRGVVDQSTVCLMGRERRQTLRLISLMALREQRGLPDASSVTCYYQPARYAPHPALCPFYCGPAPPAWQPCS